MSGDYDMKRSPNRVRSRSRSPNRLSPSHNNNQQSSSLQRDYNRPSRNQNNFHNRRDNRQRSNQNDHRGGGGGVGGDRFNQQVNLYSDRELGLKYRWEKTVHVSNIPYDMRWTALKDLFRTEVGEVMYTEVFERDGKSLGCGSVEFRTVEEAKRAVEKMHQFEYGGRKLNVKMDEEGYKTRRAKFQSLEGRLSQRGNNQFGNTNNNNNNNNNNNTGMSHSSQIAGLNSVGTTLSGYSSVSGIPSYVLQRLGIDGPITNKVFVANLDFKCDEKKIRDVFSLAGRIRDVHLKRTKEGQSRGMAVIEFEHPLEAVQAVSMLDNQQLYDRIMNVKIDLKDEGKDDGRSVKLPSGLKSIGAGLGLAGNPLRTTNVPQLEPVIPQINPINSNPVQNIQPNVSDYINRNDLTALQALSQLSPSAISALTQLATSGFSGINSLAGLQSNNSNINTSSQVTDPYSTANSLYSSLAGGYSNYQQSSGLTGNSQLSGSFYKDDDARLGQTTSVGVSSVRSQPTSSFTGGRNVLGTGLGSSLNVYSSPNTTNQRSLGGVLGGSGVNASNANVYDRSRGRSPTYR